MQLWTPDSARDEAAKYRCLNCDDARFTSQFQLIRHLNRCLKQSTPEPPHRDAYNSYLDEEMVAYVKKANREGRTLRGVFGAGHKPARKPTRGGPK